MAKRKSTAIKRGGCGKEGEKKAKNQPLIQAELL